MAANDVTMSIRGRLAADPVLKFVGEGTAVCNGRLAHTERKKQADGKWIDGDTMWVTVTAWGKLAETFAMLVKGTPVFVSGRFTYPSYEGREGESRQNLVVTADVVTIDLSAIRDIEGGQGFLTLKWGRAAGAAPVASGVESLVGQEPF
jgi:single-strand DNA-binding protein